jgi:HEAT repeat protein
MPRHLHHHRWLTIMGLLALLAVTDYLPAQQADGPADETAAIAAYTPYHDHIVEMITLARSENADTARRATAHLGNVFMYYEEVVPVLVELLDSESPLVSLAALDALADLGPNAGPAVPAIIELWEVYIGPNPPEPRGMTSQLCLVFRRIGPMAGDAAPHILEQIENPTAELFSEEEAFNALCSIAPPSLGIEAMLLERASSDGNDRYQQWYIGLLGEFGYSPETRAVLTEMFTCAHGDIQYALGVALAKNGDFELVWPFFRDGLASDSVEERERALYFLHVVGPAARNASAEVLAILDPANRVHGTNILATLFSIDCLPTPELVSMLLDNIVGPPDDLTVFASQARALLGQMMEHDPSILIQVLSLLESDDIEIRVAALRTLVAAGPNAQRAMTTVAELLADSDASVRYYAAMALNEMAPLTPECLAALDEAASLETAEDIRIMMGTAAEYSRWLSRTSTP